MNQKLIIDHCVFENVTHIIFDLGGVIVKIDYQQTIEAFKILGFSNIDTIFNYNHQKQLFDWFDSGLISERQFRNQLLTLFSADPLPDEIFDMAWNSMIIDIPFDHLQILNILKQRYELYALSNTNVLHIRHLNNLLYQKYAINNFADYFDHLFYSYEIKMLKPHIEIFDYVIKQKKLIPSSTLFIDDNVKNINAAKTVGFQTFLMPPNKLLKDVIAFS